MKKNGFPVLRNRLTVYNSVAVNGVSPFQYREDGLPASVVDLINQQKGVEKERILYRNTRDDCNVTVDYKFEDLVCIAEEAEEDYVSKAYENGSSLRVVPGTEDGYLEIVLAFRKHSGRISRFMKVRIIRMF